MKAAKSSHEGDKVQWNADLGSAKNLETLNGYKRRLHQFLHQHIRPLLARWCSEAEAEQNMPTACVMHAFRALLWSNVDAADYTDESVTDMLASLTYVRNWHGFGLGFQRSDQVWRIWNVNCLPTEVVALCARYGMRRRRQLDSLQKCGCCGLCRYSRKGDERKRTQVLGTTYW